MKTRTESQLVLAKAIQEATELKEIGKITEERRRQIVILLGKALLKPEKLTETEILIAREVAKKTLYIHALYIQLLEAEKRFDKLLEESDKERQANSTQQPQSPDKN